MFHPDEAVVNAIPHTVFERFAETGSARRVWLWFRSNNLRFPLQDTKITGSGGALGHAPPTMPSTACSSIPATLAPIPMAAHGSNGILTTAATCAAVHADCPVINGRCLIRDHHPGFIDWQTFEANRMRIGINTRPKPHQGTAGAVDSLTSGHSGPGAAREVARCSKALPSAWPLWSPLTRPL